MIKRRVSREIIIGKVKIGGDNPILIQSMTNTDTRDVDSTVAQILELEAAGCEIVRVAVPDLAAAAAVKRIKPLIHLPLIADVHFDYRLALAALDSGCDKLRLNPGNIGGKECVKAVCERAAHYGVPIRVGANSGSIAKDLRGKTIADGLVESALRNVEILEDSGFRDIVIAVKASSVVDSLEAYRRIAVENDYPLHVGITEAGTAFSGTIKSAVGIGALLADGIGDTLRVTLTAPPVEEIAVAKEILKALGLRRFGAEVVSCPTCGRTEIDLIPLARQVEQLCARLDKDIKVAVMGCVVNGPGEAAHADIGVTGGNGVGLIFRKGEVVRKVDEGDIISALEEEIMKL